MTTREAARPLRRYMRARVRAASLPPSYTITRDVTQKHSLHHLAMRDLKDQMSSLKPT